MDAVDVLVERAREAAIASGRLLSALLAVSDAATDGFDADEVAFALHWTQSGARSQIEYARYLRDVVPAVFAALCAGEVDSHRAWVFYDVLLSADDEIAATVVARVLPDAAELTTTELRRKLRRALLAADPAGATERTRRGVESRYVATSADRDGTASLYGCRLPAERAVSAFERVDAYARGAKAAGDERTLDQLRADTLLDLLTGVAPTTGPVHRSGVIDLVVPWDTAVGLADEPGELAGHGPIPADIVREIIAAVGVQPTTVWRYSIVDHDGQLLRHGQIGQRPDHPMTGRHVPTRQRARDDTSHAEQLDGRRACGQRHRSQPSRRTTRRRRPAHRDQPTPRPPTEADSTRRRPGTALARWITARDRTCRAPGCTAPARVCDIDHTHDHADGGPTSHDNLGLLCRHHHRLKHKAGWTLVQTSPGRFEWRSPTGRVYRRRF